MKNSQELEQFRIQYLGTKGALKDMMSLLGKVARAEAAGGAAAQYGQERDFGGV